MKNLILLLFICIFFNKLIIAQQYIPFPDSNAVWRMQQIENCNPLPPLFGLCYSDYQYILEGDTIISGYKYNKVFNEGWWSNCYIDSNHTNYLCTNPLFSSYYFGGIRNDTANKKVFFFQNNAFQEELLYDFNLNIGDTINGVICGGGIVTNIDSILVGNGYRKRFIIGGTTIIEGIGNVGINGEAAGPFTCGSCNCEYAWNFVCFTQNDNFLYGDSNCTVLTTKIEYSNTEDKIKIFPNPANEIITIINNDNSIKEITVSIFNITGLQIKYAIYQLEKMINININTLTQGIYLFRIQYGNKIENKKLIIQQ